MRLSNKSSFTVFIESLFLRLPVPQIVLAETSPGKFAVVDGKQRLSSIAEFCIDGSLRLTGCEYRPELNNKTYADIEADDDLALAVFKDVDLVIDIDVRSVHPHGRPESFFFRDLATYFVFSVLIQLFTLEPSRSKIVSSHIGQSVG